MNEYKILYTIPGDKKLYSVPVHAVADVDAIRIFKVTNSLYKLINCIFVKKMMLNEKY